MPALDTCTLTSTDARKNVPIVSSGHVIITLRTPTPISPAEDIIRQTLTPMNYLYTINIPIGTAALIFNRRNFDTNATPSSSIMTTVGKIIPGTGNNINITVLFQNPQPATDYSLTSNSSGQFLVLIEIAQLKQSIVGF